MRCSAYIVPLGFEREKRQKKRLHERNINSTETQQFLNPLFTGYIDLKILERVSKRERERERESLRGSGVHRYEANKYRSQVPTMWS